MSGHGGRRPGAGRPSGARNQKTIVRQQIAEQAGEEGVLPVTVMLRTMRKLYAIGTLEADLAACKIADMAAPYVHPRLSTIEQNVNSGLVVQVVRFGELHTVEVPAIEEEAAPVNGSVN